MSCNYILSIFEKTKIMTHFKKSLFSVLVCLVTINISNAQCLAGDCTNGFGKFKNQDRTFYAFFENGVPSRMGLEFFLGFTIAYQIEDGNKHGIEVKYNPKGLFVINQYENGLKNGYMLTGNYKKYSAQAYYYENDEKKHSLHSDFNAGKKKIKRYVACLGNCKEGLGLRRVDDSYYLGIFEKRKPTPIGVDLWKDSSEMYLGGAHNFVRKPFGIFYYEKSGYTYIGEFKKSKRDGIGVWISKEGVLTAYVMKKGKEKDLLYEEKLN